MSVLGDCGYGARFAHFYDRLYPPSLGGPAIDYLAPLPLPDAGPPLELAVGTGRIAIGLAERVGEVVGVDSSSEMLDELQRTPNAVRGVLGDMRDFEDEGGHGLVYLVLGSLSIVLEREEQSAVLAVCARAAAPGAAVVVETHNPAFVHALHGDRRTESILVPYPARDTALLSHSTLDREHELWQLSHVFFDDGRARVASEVSRLISPERLDGFAADAGLRLEARHGDWDGSPPADVRPMVVSTYRATG